MSVHTPLKPLSFVASLFLVPNPDYYRSSPFRTEPQFLLRDWVPEFLIRFVGFGLILVVACFFETPLALTTTFFCLSVVVAWYFGNGSRRAVQGSDMVNGHFGVLCWWCLGALALTLLAWGLSGQFHGHAHVALWGGFGLGLTSFSIAYWQ